MISQNKKGQGLSTSTLILLILGLIILVILIWGFVTGWSNFKSLINPTNVDSVVEDCSSACSIGSQYSYCSGERTLRVNEDKLSIKSTCAVFSSISAFAKYKISPCPTISCGLQCSDIVIDGKKGSVTATAGKYDASVLANEEKCFVN
ncbi:hypothetical protein GW922_02010 [Candidatus Pacearchaeota archaeon]|nr:hypothetical protein [Candidatus Pacearchaeota archaeon]PJA71069.1 MAG: hypothetical protein CO153_03560 [Candidatus Pacearchaeota archaeon CG_4_9_14_3_um_filter_30_11]